MSSNVTKFPSPKTTTPEVTTTTEISVSTEDDFVRWPPLSESILPMNFWKQAQMQSMMGIDHLPSIEFTEQYYDIVEYYTRGAGYEPR